MARLYSPVVQFVQVKQIALDYGLVIREIPAKGGRKGWQVLRRVGNGLVYVGFRGSIEGLLSLVKSASRFV